MPPVRGLVGPPDPGLEGVVISHGHGDHHGLAGAISPEVPLVMGRATERILREAAFFSRDRFAPRAAMYLRDRVPLRMGPFTITPYLVDHSAFDAYALLVEAGGRRLFYSGDLRAHGRKPGTFERLLRHPPRDVHAVLMEGTRLGRSDQPTLAGSEGEVEQRALEVFRRTPGMVLAYYSVQNIDRLVSLFRAARRSGRLFVLDLYGAAVVAATGNPKIPEPGWRQVRVFAPLRQRIRVKNERAFDRVEAVRTARIHPEALSAQAGRLVMTFRHSMRADLERAGCLAGAGALWSTWPGYLARPDGIATTRWLKAQRIPLAIAHASGHASVADLRRLASALAPARIVPVHTDAAGAYPAVFPGVERHRDGERWAV